MNHRRHGTALLPNWATATALILLAVPLAGCGASSSHSVGVSASTSPSAPASGPVALPTGRPGTPKAGLPGHVKGSDPTAVAAAAVTVDWTFDTDLDTSPADAQRRSTPWLTPAYAAQVTQAQQVAPPGADWTVMAGHRGYTSVQVVRAYDDPIPDTPTSAWREFKVTVTEHGRDGWTGSASSYVQYAHLTRATTTGPWQVDQMRVAQ